MFTDVLPDRMQAYTDAMAKGMEDKLFFLPYLPRGAAVLDFGCADGRMLGAMHLRRPDLHLAGLDCSAPALDQARARGVRAPLFTTTQEGAQWVHAQAPHRPVVLLASSVLHEVAHYGGPAGWAGFWAFVHTTPFFGIAVRDFSISQADAQAPNPAFCAAVRTRLPDWQRQSFERLWGPILDQGRAVHAALKAPWTASWDREGPENYFPVFREDLHAEITRSFVPQLWEAHAHPYTDTSTRHTFGMGLPCPSHIKAFATRP